MDFYHTGGKKEHRSDKLPTHLFVNGNKFAVIGQTVFVPTVVFVYSN